MPKFLSFDEIQEKISQKHKGSITLIEYGGMIRLKSTFLCNICGYEWVTTVHAITKPNYTSCPNCALIIKRNKLNHNIEYVRSYIEENNCILISEEYVNVGEKLDVIFECGHEGKISFECFQRGQRCSKCSRTKMAKSQRLSEEDIKNRLYEKNLKFIEFPNDYKNRKSLLTCSCLKCGYTETKTLASFLNVDGCVACRKTETLLITSGSMANNWQGGKSSLTSYLKKCIVPWKKESMMNSGYKCVICGEKFEDVHHTYNFYNIMMESLDELGLKLENSIQKYTEEQLKQIETLVLQKHKVYPGVCLCRYHHTLYHKEFGLLNNTPSQFTEFLSRIKSGEIIISN